MALSTSAARNSKRRLPLVIEDILAVHPDLDPDRLYAEAVDAYVQAARAVLGNHAPLVGEWLRIGAVRLTLNLIARDHVQDAHREVPRAPLRGHGSDLEGIDDGDVLAFVLPIHAYAVDATAGLPALLGEAFPFRFDALQLQSACRAAMSQWVRHYLPPRPFPPQSLGALLARGGGWLVGCESGESLENHVRIEGAVLRSEVEGMERETTTFGLQLSRTTPRGHELIEAVQTHASVFVSDLLDVPVCEAQLPALREALGALATRLHPDWGRSLEPLFDAMLLAPQPGSLAEWARDAFETAEPLRVEHNGRWLLARVVDQRVAGTRFGGPQAMLRLLFERSGEADAGACWLSLGTLGADAVTRPGPGSVAENAHASLLVATWRAELLATLGRIVRDARDWAAHELEDAFLFRPVSMLEFALRHGLPTPPASPQAPREDHALRLATRRERNALLRALQAGRAITSTQRVLAAYRVGESMLALGDSVRGRAFSEIAVWLRTAAGELVSVLFCDEYHRWSRWVVDGDTFALQRFLEWLRSSIERAELDERLHFFGREIPDEMDDDDGDGVETTPESLSISEWLRFGQSAPDDARWVDVRCQDYVAASGMAPNLAPRYRAELERVALPAWRRFLTTHVDASLHSGPSPAPPMNPT